MDTESSSHLENDVELEQQALRSALTLFDNEMVVDDHDALHQRVEEAVVEMLTKNPERLMSVLYRIDVGEEKVDAVMKNAPVGSIASQISTLIIDRMREKIVTRQRYQASAKKRADEKLDEL